MDFSRRKTGPTPISIQGRQVPGSSHGKQAGPEPTLLSAEALLIQWLQYYAEDVLAVYGSLAQVRLGRVQMLV